MSEYNGTNIPEVGDKPQTLLSKIALTLSRILIIFGGGSPSDDSFALVPVAGRTKKVSLEITRPADVLAYTAKDVIGNAALGVLTFPDIALENGAGGYIVKARLITNKVDFLAQCRLHLYTVAPTSIADNAQFALLYANAANRIGFIDFPALTTEGTGSDATMSICTPGSATTGNVPLPFICDTASRAIYGILETISGGAPASGQKFFIELLTEQN